MKKIIIYPIFFTLCFICWNCVEEDHFGYSNSANILSLQLSNQNGSTYINTTTDSTYTEVANGTDLSQIIIRELKLSPFAKTTLKEGDTLDFSQGNQNMTITAESGIQKVWNLNVFEVGSQPQIANSDFNQWYDVGTYLDIGLDDASSAWGTSNPGAVFGGIMPNAEQVELNSGNYAVKLVTRFTTLGGLAGKPIAAGSLFTGDFDQDNISIANPTAAVKFGVPFTALPTSFSIEYQYTSGKQNIDKHQNNLPYPDTGDIYVLLERRESDTVKRVATAWFRIEEDNATMEQVTVDFVYGELPIDSPDYMLPKNGETYASSEELPTHITVVCSSSSGGEIFQGAEGSELIIDNFVLNY